MSGVNVHQLPQVPLLPLSSCTRTRPSVSRETAPAPMLGTFCTGVHDCAVAAVTAHTASVAILSIRKSFIFLLNCSVLSNGFLDADRRHPAGWGRRRTSLSNSSGNLL